MYVGGYKLEHYTVKRERDGYLQSFVLVNGHATRVPPITVPTQPLAIRPKQQSRSAAVEISARRVCLFFVFFCFFSSVVMFCFLETGETMSYLGLSKKNYTFPAPFRVMTPVPAPTANPLLPSTTTSSSLAPALRFPDGHAEALSSSGGEASSEESTEEL